MNNDLILSFNLVYITKISYANLFFANRSNYFSFYIIDLIFVRFMCPQFARLGAKWKTI